MIIPLGDDNPVERFPYVNTGIIALNVLAFFALAFRSDYPDIIRTYALVPDQFRAYSLMTHMFLHGSLLHLFGNMLFLAIVGKNVEDRVGHVPYLLLYILAGFVASNLHIVISAQTGGEDMPMIGASGAVAGIMAAYAAFFPRNQIRLWIVWFWWRTFYVASAWAIGLWFVMQLASSLGSYRAGAATGVAYWAHVGGFGAGFVVALVFNRIVPRDELERSIALFFARERPDRALDRYERFRRKFSWRALSPILQHAVGEAYEERADIPRAIEAYELFLKAHPEDPRAPETRAKVAALHGAPLPAPTSAPQPVGPVRGATLDPLERAISLGRQCFRENNWDGAIEQFKIVLDGEPRRTEARAYLGVAYYQKGLFKEAIREMTEAIRLGAETAIAYNNLALAYLASGQRDEAADAWHRALRLDPHNKTARDGLKQLRMRPDEP